jgi:hypothetical protein
MPRPHTNNGFSPLLVFTAAVLPACRQTGLRETAQYTLATGQVWRDKLHFSSSAQFSFGSGSDDSGDCHTPSELDKQFWALILNFSKTKISAAARQTEY